MAPLPLGTQARSADNYRQPLAHDGQMLQAPSVPSQSTDPVYDPARTPILPDLNVVAATPSSSSHTDEVNPILPSGQNISASLLASDEDRHAFSKSITSHSRALNPGMQEMPIAPPLPAKFGTDEDYSESAYSAIESDFAHDIRRALKVANQ